jgi:regulatory protein YycI of two-component signal transduction system YycFG
MEEQEEIQKKMKDLMPYLNLKKRNFADPNDKKAQVNIRKRLDTAYEAIRKENMNDLAEYLQSSIVTDDAYGLRYTGPIIWEITIK